MLFLIASTVIAALGFLVFVLLIIGTHGETPQALTRKPPTRLTGFTRRTLGVYVRRPDDNDDIPSDLATTGRR